MAAYGQNFSIVACVAALIAAFREADTLVQRLKVRRVSRRAPPPPDDLEDSVYYAPEEIDREKQRGLARFGDVFDRGDHIAIIEIQQITIQMQIGLLDQLRNAAEDDEFTDYASLIDLADSARDSTISALIGLRKRLMSGSTSEMPTRHRPQQQYVPPPPPPPPAAPVPRAPAAPTFAMPPPPSRKAPIPPPSPLQGSLQGSLHIPSPVNHQQPYSPGMLSPDAPYRNRANSSASIDEGASDAGGSQHNPGKRGILGFLRRPSNSVSSTDHHVRTEDDKRASIHSAGSHPTTRSVPRTREWIDPYMPRAASNPTRSDSVSGPVREQSFSYGSVPAPVRNSTFTHGSVSSRSGVSSAESTPATTASNVSTVTRNRPTVPATLTTPSPENDFLGFCKGAWRVQNDDPKATIDRRDFTMSAQSQVTYPSCSKCAFKGHVNSKVIWNKVITDETRGIKYRWSLLAKSHVKQKSVTDHSYGYQCIFCVFQGHEHCIYTLSTYLDHLSREHRGQPLDDVLLYRTRCVNDRVCKDSEKFDINLFPLEGAHEESEDQKSDVVSDHLIYGMGAFELAA